MSFFRSYKGANITMTILTTTNQRAQFYYNYSGGSHSRQAKEKRLELLEESLNKQGLFVDELFPMKQGKMLDKIIYDTTANGICKIGSAKLAEYADASTSTVTNFNRSLKVTGQFIIGRLRNSRTNCGKLVYVDKLHENFNDIMRDVFLLNTQQITELIAKQDFPESVGTVSIEQNKSTSNIINSFNSKQASNMYINESYKAIQEEIEKESTNTKEYLQLYTSNPYQVAFYEFLNSLPLPFILESNKTVLALRIGSSADVRVFNKAKTLVVEMADRINSGYKYEHVVAAFTGGLLKSLSYSSPGEKSDAKSNRSAPSFYDWLTIRE